MNLKHLVCSSLVLSMAFAWIQSAEAAPPWQSLVPFKRIEADPGKEYSITEENGPWMIMATTFRGDKADAQARELALELRKYYKLPAYTYKKSYDYRGTVVGRGFNEDGSPKTMKYQQDQQVQEVAVLVGDYPSVDDGKAQKVLKLLKYAQPESLALENGKGTSQSFGKLRRLQQSLLHDGDDDKKKGPMRRAFVTTNPLLPKEYFAPRGVDKLVLDMNKDVKHSLLNCRGKYSVKIATFRGLVVLEQKKIESLEGDEPLVDKKGRKIESPLAVAAVKANRLTEALRAKGIEAYEFHDRYESIVTVGSFASVGTPRQDGKTEINPQVHAIMKQFSGQQSDKAAQLKNGGTTPGMQAKSIVVPKSDGMKATRITLDVQPMPVEVPRRSISSDYQQVNYLE